MNQPKKLFSLLLLSALLVFSSKGAAKENSSNTLSSNRITKSYGAYDDNGWEVELYVATASKSHVNQRLVKRSFQLQYPRERTLFEQEVEKLIALGKVQSDEKDRIEDETGISEAGFPFYVGGGERHGFKEILRLLKMLRGQGSISESPSVDTADALVHIIQIASAFNLNFKYPIDSQVDVLEILSKVDRYIGNAQHGPAKNMESGGEGDRQGLQNPYDSTYWKKPYVGSRVEIGDKELYHGFGRTQLPDLTQEICEYDELKDGYGIHGGFEVECDDLDWKIKFGSETHTEAFNSRVFWALGYHATPVEYVEGIRVEYDRRIFTEYNSRKQLSFEVSAFGVPFREVHLQEYLDPFKDAIAFAVLKNGDWLTSSELKSALLQVPWSKGVEQNPEIYNAQLEEQIAYLILKEGSAEPKFKKVESIGPWSWNDFDHGDRRELRGLGILTAWLNLYDIRMDNNRLRLVRSADGVELRHYISDLGSGFGRADSVFNYENSRLNAFPWTFTEPHIPSPAERDRLWRRDQRKIFIRNYLPIFYSKPMTWMDTGDARWMARMIAELTEDQLRQALLSTGYSSSECVLLLNKLMFRRDKLVRDLEIDGVSYFFPDVSWRKLKFSLNYDPQKDGLFSARVEGRRLQARDEGLILRQGELQPRR